MHKLGAQQAMSASCLLGLQGNGVVPDLPALGTALPIIITNPAPVEGKSRGPLVLPSVGSWVKLRNVRSWVVAGQLQVCHHCLYGLQLSSDITVSNLEYTNSSLQCGLHDANWSQLQDGQHSLNSTA